MMGKRLFVPLCLLDISHKVRRSTFTALLCSVVFLQASWTTLRSEFAALNAAQLHHMLRQYGAGRACPSSWTPSLGDSEDAVRTGERNRQTSSALGHFLPPPLFPMMLRCLL